jgi:type III pantothenate kinase
MLLAIDIGNTNVVLGLWDGTLWREQWRLRTVHEKTADEYWIDLSTLLRDHNFRGAVSQVVLSSVVPPLTGTFTALCHRYLGLTPLHVTHATETGIRVCTENPAEVGADRIVNAAAVAALWPGRAAIVIDMGTATTFDLVSADAELLGVIIAPGMRLAADALAARAAQLSRVALEAPPRVLGRNTIHAVQSGLVYGYVSMVEGMVRRLVEECQVQPVVIGTGGLISVLRPLTGVIDQYEPWLTLTGLRLIAERNRERGQAQ